MDFVTSFSEIKLIMTYPPPFYHSHFFRNNFMGLEIKISLPKPGLDGSNGPSPSFASSVSDSTLRRRRVFVDFLASDERLELGRTLPCLP
jgi:hypothetical protein